MSKRNLRKTIKKAKRKLKKQIKKLMMKGGNYTEVPQQQNQTTGSIVATAGSVMVAGEANELNVLSPEIKGGAKLPKSIKKKRRKTMKRLKTLKKGKKGKKKKKN